MQLPQWSRLHCGQQSEVKRDQASQDWPASGYCWSWKDQAEDQPMLCSDIPATRVRLVPGCWARNAAQRPPPVSPTQHPSHSHVSINIKPGSSMTSSSWANPRRPGRLGNQSQAARRAEQPITGGLVDCNQEGNRTFDLCTTFVRYLKNWFVM